MYYDNKAYPTTNNDAAYNTLTAERIKEAREHINMLHKYSKLEEDYKELKISYKLLLNLIKQHYPELVL